MRLTGQRTPTARAVVCGNAELTWRELDEMADRACDGLLRTAARPGDVIGLSSPNRPDTLAMMFGIARAGMTVLQLNPMSTANEIAFQMEDVGATMLLSDGGLSGTEVIAAGRPTAVQRRPGQVFAMPLEAGESFRRLHRTRLLAVLNN